MKCDYSNTMGREQNVFGTPRALSLLTLSLNVPRGCEIGVVTFTVHHLVGFVNPITDCTEVGCTEVSVRQSK